MKGIEYLRRKLKEKRNRGLIRYRYYDMKHWAPTIDPTMPKDHQFLEYCINGVIYRYPRGVMVEVPASVFETIERKEQYKRMSMQLISSFMDDGKQLDA